MVEITSKLSLDDYVSVNYHMVYRKWAVKGMVGFGFFFILLSLFSLVSGNFSWFLLFFGLFLTVGLRIQIYFAAKRNYKDGRVSEQINYVFDNSEIKITGKTFSSQLTWSKVYSVTENKDFVLIWQNRLIANPIPKRDFKESEWLAFKQIVSEQAGLKNRI